MGGNLNYYSDDSFVVAIIVTFNFTWHMKTTTAEEYIKELDEAGEAWSNDMQALAEALNDFAKIYHEQQIILEGVKFAESKQGKCNCETITDYSGSVSMRTINPSCPEHGLKPQSERECKGYEQTKDTPEEEINCSKDETEAEAFADSKERRGCAYWNGLYRGYIQGRESKLREAEKIKWSSEKTVAIINGEERLEYKNKHQRTEPLPKRTDKAPDWKRVGELANEIQKIVRNDSNN